MGGGRCSVIQALEDAWIAVRKESWMEAWRDV